ncbi:tail fiber domain-containing protein [Methylobacterium ajmalii]|uniref:Tail fiber domain-containing protein n=1 Tax=Methylobacterium ajmalii TaxID=2738439 RepID=A0ABV0A4G1_9HYPH
MSNDYLIRQASDYTGAPTSYTILGQLAFHTLGLENYAGYQQNFNTDAGGRTMVPAYYVNAFHQAPGDFNVYQGAVGVAEPASHGAYSAWTGRSSGTLTGGQTGAVTSNVNVYGSEYTLVDNANNDVAALGQIVNLDRRGGRAAGYTSPWIGFRTQSIGTQQADAAFQATGPWKVGLDLTGASVTPAIALRAEQHIYLNAAATNPGSTWFAGDGTSFGGASIHADPYNNIYFTSGGIEAFVVKPNGLVNKGDLEIRQSPTIGAWGSIILSSDDSQRDWAVCAVGSTGINRDFGILDRAGNWRQYMNQNGNTYFNGNVMPWTSGATSLGLPYQPWDKVFANTGSIQASDARLKSTPDGNRISQDDDWKVTPLTEAEINWAIALASEIGVYVWNDAIAKKGVAGARRHLGVTVQRVIQLALEHGLNPLDYGIVCIDEWDAIDSGPVQIPAGERYSLRHDELGMLISRGLAAAVTVLRTVH